ncbi:MAG: endonuclease MutS2, partial [Anaerolineae bacterium]|nr:endonuclease MutS2 [Anaerolineae bacterium]
MDDKYLITLEYFKIIAQLEEHTAFSASRALAHALRPSPDADEVRQRLQETDEAKALLAVHPDVTVGGAHDVRALADRADRGAQLQPPELVDIRSTIFSARTLRYRLQRVADEYPLLAGLAAEIEPLSHLIDEIDRCLDADGSVLDSASPALARIRREGA